MTKKLKAIPSFADEAAERKFWEEHDSTDYVDWSKAQRVRLPLSLREQIKIATNIQANPQSKKSPAAWSPWPKVSDR